MKQGLIFLNGNVPEDKILATINYDDKFIVCADGAYDYLKNFAKPDILIGDFDSISEVPQGVSIKRFPIDKDYTDGHLAVLEVINHDVDAIEIYGAFGGRPDHEFGNFALLALAARHNINAVIKGDFDIYLLTKDITLNTKKGCTVSLVPYSDKAHINSTRGLKFNADNLTLDKIHLIGLSNTAIEDEIYVSVGEGSVLMFVQRR